MIQPAATHSAGDVAVEFTHVTFRYAPDQPAAVDDVSFTVQRGDFLGLIGPNGGGKSTLLKLMLGLLEPQAGTVRVFGVTPTQARQRIGYVPQHSRIDATVPANVRDIVLMGQLARSSWGFRFGNAAQRAAQAALERVHAADLADRPFGTLSGGQRQRVLIARALASDAQLLLLDEPTAGVDAHIERSITDLLHELSAAMPIVMVNHDISFVCAHLNRVACMNHKLSCHATDEISDDIIADMYHGHIRLIHHQDDCPLHEPGCDHGCPTVEEPVKHEHGAHPHHDGCNHDHPHTHLHAKPTTSEQT